MKKFLLLPFLTLSLLLLVLPVYAATEGGAVSETEDAGAFYDEEEDSLTIEYRTQTIKCENAAIKSEDVTYLPLREVLSAYGASISSVAYTHLMPRRFIRRRGRNTRL